MSQELFSKHTRGRARFTLMIRSHSREMIHPTLLSKAGLLHNFFFPVEAHGSFHGSSHPLPWKLPRKRWKEASTEAMEASTRFHGNFHGSDRRSFHRSNGSFHRFQASFHELPRKARKCPDNWPRYATRIMQKNELLPNLWG